MISCSVSVSDERTASAVRAVLSLCGIGCENGSVLITDLPDADMSAYSGAVVLTRTPAALKESERVRILPLPLSYAGLTDALNSLSGLTDEMRSLASADETASPEISGGKIVWQGKSIQLTERETMLFEYLRSERGRIVPRDKVMDAVWSGYDGRTNVADVYISYLRKKLVPLFGQGVLVTVRGRGYVLNLPE